jgi:hypothetical protein
VRVEDFVNLVFESQFPLRRIAQALARDEDRSASAIGTTVVREGARATTPAVIAATDMAAFHDHLAPALDALGRAGQADSAVQKCAPRCPRLRRPGPARRPGRLPRAGRGGPHRRLRGGIRSGPARPGTCPGGASCQPGPRAPRRYLVPPEEHSPAAGRLGRPHRRIVAPWGALRDDRRGGDGRDRSPGAPCARPGLG